ncbi:hypothetical protein ElyMa_000649200 [Elysia marginata]|uniref:Uncharacterized protein n=1 Tax=Elysia marginata TaxID=1093978 RepID=A0AAV4GG89_9GAST|nr:hypothetical protein ElyMa_000649200 [Elysia marginata]
MYPSHQISIERQTPGKDVPISPEQYPTPETRTECIHLTRAVSNARHSERMYPSHQSSNQCQIFREAVSNARHSERMYPSHQSSIQCKTLREDVSISPEQYSTPDTVSYPIASVARIQH